MRIPPKLLELRILSPLFRSAGAAYLRIRPCVLHIDEPERGAIESVIGITSGWFACRNKGATRKVRINHADLTWVEVDRPDVAPIFGQEHVGGFRAVFDLNQILAGGARLEQRLTLELLIDGKIAAAKQLELRAGVSGDPQIAAAVRARKRAWLELHSACPICPPGTGALDFGESVIRCRECGASFPQEGLALDFLPHNSKQEFRIDEWSDISAHQYDEVASGIIEDIRRRGGKVLDCGSGLRSNVDEAVICLDVAAFPTVDILGVNQRLPFRDAVFDAVLSLNVLEHVTDPFVSASELIRVLKPGGTLYCCIPFLQPEHGFPHHYFNATRSGLRQLFGKNVELIDHFVPGSGEPVWTLQWFLSWYAKELPVDEKQKFLDLRFRDIVDTPAAALLDESWVSKLSTKGKWQLASTTAAVFRKSTDG